MDLKRRKSGILIPTIIMGVIALILLLIGYSKGQGQHIGAMKNSITMIVNILPILVFAFIVAGMVQSLVPQQLLSKWIGSGSGMRGILIGTVTGALIPGGPYVCMPIVAGMLSTGAGVGTMVAFVAGRALWNISSLPLEVGILGWKFTCIRFASTFIFPPIAGLIAQTFFGSIK